jgi:nucleoside-diphosphate-sugar epimerase
VGDIPIRQHPDNVLMALSESKRKNGYITIFGDGDKIKRNFTHVSNVVQALVLAAESDVHGTEIDIMNGKLWSLSEIAKFYNCEVRHTEARKGDIENLQMTGVEKAKDLLGFTADIDLTEGIKPYVV